MLRHIYTILKYLGIVPMFQNEVWKHRTYIICLLLFNQARFSFDLYITINKIFLGKSVNTFGVISTTCHVFQQIFVIVYLYTSLCKTSEWKSIQEAFEEDDSETSRRNNIYLICGMFYIFVVITETFESERDEMHFLSWINFHIFQSLQFFHLFFFRNVVFGLTSYYKRFRIMLWSDIQNSLSVLTIKQKTINCGIRFAKLSEMVSDCNTIFGLSSLAATTGIFLNILAGLLYLYGCSDVSNKSFVTYLLMYLIQTILALVSSKLNFSFFTYSIRKLQLFLLFQACRSQYFFEGDLRKCGISTLIIFTKFQTEITKTVN